MIGALIVSIALGSTQPILEDKGHSVTEKATDAPFSTYDCKVIDQKYTGRELVIAGRTVYVVQLVVECPDGTTRTRQDTTVDPPKEE